MVRALDDNRIYTIKLLLEPFADCLDLTREQLDSYLVHKDRVYEIIESSLFGYEILTWYIKHNKFGATIRVNRAEKNEITGEQTVREDIADNYGERSVDTWLEGDCSLGQVKDEEDSNNDQYVELGISLISIHLGDCLSNKRKKAEVDGPAEKKR